MCLISYYTGEYTATENVDTLVGRIPSIAIDLTDILN